MNVGGLSFLEGQTACVLPPQNKALSIAGICVIII